MPKALVVWLAPSLKWKVLRTRVLGLVLILCLGIFLATYLKFFPTGNVCYNLGLGPKLLKGVDWSHTNVSPQLPSAIWGVLDYVGLVGTIGLSLLFVQHSGLRISTFFTKEKSDPKTLIKWSIALYCCFYFLVVVLMSSLFDRYALPLVPFLVVLVLPPAVRWVRISSALGLFCLILTAVFSVAATHDYMSWNRARKTAYDYLSEEAHIPPTFIDGGFEINGWLQAGPDRFANETDKSWWFVTEDDYVLAFDQLEGFEQWQAYPFPTLLPIGTDSLWILKKAYIREFDDDDFPISSDLESRSPNNENFRSSQPNIEFSNGQLQVEGKARSGKYALKLTAQDAFGLTTKFWDFNAGDRIMVSVWRYPAGSGAGIVIDSEYGNSFYLFDNKTVVVPAENGWEQLQAEMVIPSFPGKDRISIYIWNNTQEDVWLDDIRIDRTRPGD